MINPRLLGPLLAVFALSALSACNCFRPVDECPHGHCRGDGGLDGGDGGADAGQDGGGDAGPLAACEGWDGGGVGKCAAITGYVRLPTECSGQCVLYPISTPGVLPNLEACVACGCDPSKISSVPAGATVGPATFCDAVYLQTTIPGLLDQAFPNFDAGCVPSGALAYSCVLWQNSGGFAALGDAGYARVCAATLIPRVTQVQCRVFIK